MYEIAISNEQTLLEIDEERLRSVARHVLGFEEVRAASVSIAIVDDAALRILNRRHLGHDDDTDVLSFLLECEQEDNAAADVAVGPGQLVGWAESSRPTTNAPRAADDDVAPPPRGRGKRIEGEVIASAEMAVKRAGEFHWSPIDELTLYVVHGLLHLAGYDDLADEERALMRSRERALLSQWNLAPHES